MKTIHEKLVGLTTATQVRRMLEGTGHVVMPVEPTEEMRIQGLLAFSAAMGDAPTRAECEAGGMDYEKQSLMHIGGVTHSSRELKAAYRAMITEFSNGETQ